MLIVDFSLSQLKNHVQIHIQRLHVLGWGILHKRSTQKFGRLDLFRRCIWNQTTSYTCINVTCSNMFNYVKKVTVQIIIRFQKNLNQPQWWCFQWAYPSLCQAALFRGFQNLRDGSLKSRPGPPIITIQQLKVYPSHKLTWLAGKSPFLIGDTSTQMVSFRCHSLVFWRQTTILVLDRWISCIIEEWEFLLGSF